MATPFLTLAQFMKQEHPELVNEDDRAVAEFALEEFPDSFKVEEFDWAEPGAAPLIPPPGFKFGKEPPPVEETQFEVTPEEEVPAPGEPLVRRPPPGFEEEVTPPLAPQAPAPEVPDIDVEQQIPRGATGQWEEEPVSKKQRVTDLAKNFARGGLHTVSGMGGALQALGLKETGQKLNKFTKDVEDEYLKTIGNPTFLDDVASGFGSAATFFIPGFGTMGAVRALAFAPKLATILGIGTSAVIESMVEGGSVFNEAKERGDADDNARIKAGKTFALNLPLNVILDRWIFNKLPSGKKLIGTLSGAGQEATQEAVQNVISTVSLGDPILNKEFAAQTFKEGLIGGIVGGGIGGVKAVGEAVVERPPAEEEAAPPVEPTPPVVPPTEPTVPPVEEEAEIAPDIENVVNKVIPEVERRGEERETIEGGVEQATNEWVRDNPDVELTDEVKSGIQAGVDLASRNPKSGIPSSRHMNTKINQIREVPEGKVNVFMDMDVDWFKEHNDTFGDKWGDRVLKKWMPEINELAKAYNLDHFHRTGDENTTVDQIDKADLQTTLDNIVKFREKLDEIEIELPNGNFVPLSMTMAVSIKDLGAANQLLKAQKKKTKNTLVFDNEIKKDYTIGDVVGQDFREINRVAGLLPTTREMEAERGRVERAEVPGERERGKRPPPIVERDVPGVKPTEAEREIPEAKPTEAELAAKVKEPKEAEKEIREQKEKVLSAIRNSNPASLTDYIPSKKDFGRGKFQAFTLTKDHPDGFARVAEILGTTDRDVVETAIRDAVDLYLAKGKPRGIPKVGKRKARKPDAPLFAKRPVREAVKREEAVTKGTRGRIATEFLREAVSASEGREVRLRDVRVEDYTLAQKEAVKAAKKFGKEVVIVEGDNFFDGVTVPTATQEKFRNVIFIHKNTKRPELKVLWHELSHQLKRDDPKAFQELYDYVLEQARDTELVKLVGEQLKLDPKLSALKAHEEVVADVVGDVGLRQGFWQRLYVKSPKLFQKVVDLFRKIFKITPAERTTLNPRFIKDVNILEKQINRVIDRFKKEAPRREAEAEKELPLFARREPDNIDKATDKEVFFSKAKPDVAEKTFKEEETFTGFDVPSETIRDKFIRKVQDKFKRLKTVQEAVKKTGREIPEKEDAYLAEELFHGKTENELNGFEDVFVRPLLDQIAKKNITVDELGLFLYAKHAPERNAYIQKINPKFREKGVSGSGMTDEQSAQILEAFDKAGQTQRLNDLAELTYNINKERLRVLKEHGLESEETLDSWRAAYKFYVPLKGFAESSEERAIDKMFPQVGKGFDIRGRESRRALGRESRASNILSHVVAQTEESIVRAQKNEVGVRFLNFVRENPNKDLWEIDPVVKKPRFNERTGEVVTGIDPRFRLADNVLSVKDGGKEFYIVLKDPSLASAMKNVGTDKGGQLLQFMASINRFLAMVNTTLNPEFVASNFTRDIQTAIFNITSEDTSKLAAKVVKDATPAIKGAYQEIRKHKKDNKWRKWYREFVEDGGQVGFFGLENIDRQQLKIIKSIELLRGGTKANIRKMFGAVKNYVMDANKAVENGTRLALYKNLRENGVSRAKAASAAKNITVNFNRKGELGTLFNALFMFTNASIQGTARLFRALKTRRMKVIAGGIVTGAFLLAEMNRMLGGDDEDDVPFYDKIDDWVKENNLIMMRPDGKGGHFKIPLPYGYNIFYVLGEKMNEIVHNPDRKLKGAVRLGAAAVNAFNPLGGSKRFLQIMTPTVTRPITDLSLNENFAGNPIKPEQPRFGPKIPESQLQFKSVGRFNKAISETINSYTGGDKYKPGLVDVSPEVLDHILEFSTGGAGRFINNTVTTLANIYQGEDIILRKIPFVRRFRGEKSEYYDNQQFYEHLDDIEVAKKQLEDLRKNQPKKVRDFMKENGRILDMESLEKAAEGEISGLREKIKKFEEHNLQKKAEPLQAQIDRIQLVFNRQWNKVVGRK